MVQFRSCLLGGTFWAWTACLSAIVGADDTPLLFNGTSLSNWTTVDGDPVDGGWEVVDGMIHLRPGRRRTGHIVTREEFGDFQLQFEWKIATGGNSGLKYRVRSYGGKTRGCEYQILDDTNYHKGCTPKTSAGALYDLCAPNKKKRLLPAGQFNRSAILVQNDCITHWLNGEKILSVKVGSRQWEARVAASKFCELGDFARNQQGKIMLTDHGSEVWYRNFSFLLLPATLSSNP